MLLKTKTIKSKKAVSVVVGYVLLVVFAIVLGGLTFTWIKTYVPTEGLECQEGVSVFIKKSIFNTSTSELKITVKNTGRFSFAGYFIHATNESDQKLATIDLSGYLNETLGGSILGNSVLFFSGTDNYLKSGEERNHVFDIPSDLGILSKVKITPIRFEEVENRNRFVSCESSKTEQFIGEDVGPIICISDDISVTCGSRVCGSVVNNCNNLVSCPPDDCELTGPGYVCDGTGQCVPPAACTDTCSSLGYVCGTWDICGVSTICGTCTGDGEECNVAGQCVSLCGNGVIDDGEECDDGNIVDGDGCSSTCTIESGGWTCNGEPSICQLCGNGVPEGTEQCDDGNTIDNDQCKNDCTLSPGTDCSSNCIATQGSSWGYCTTNTECTSVGGTTPFSGNQFCGAGEGRCCCTP